MKIEPLFSYVVLERDKLKSKLLIIPDIADKRNAPSYGRIVATGRMCEDDVKALVGKLVLFKQHAGAWVKTPDGDEYFALEEKDLLGELS